MNEAQQFEIEVVTALLLRIQFFWNATSARSVSGSRRSKSEMPPTLEDEGMAFPPNVLSHSP
jgi:hypothetical protein